jgi:hypothetical protein
MKIIIDSDFLEGLTYRGVLAVVAVTALGDGRWSTAQLAQAVSCNSSLMLEGMGELHTLWPEFIGKQTKNKWPLGTGVASTEKVQILESDSTRRQDFLDDVKKAYEFVNKGLPFTMGSADGAAVKRWLKQNKEVTREEWRRALGNRYKSEGVVKTQALYLWIGRLLEYLEAPLDRYGKVMPNGIGGKIGQAIGVEQSNNDSRRAAVAAAGRNSKS